MSTQDLNALPPEIAARIDAYSHAVAKYASEKRHRTPEAMVELIDAERAARSALETAITALVRDGGQQQQDQGWTKKDQQQEPEPEGESSMSNETTMCNECGHNHTGAALGYICVGCPCSWRPETASRGTLYCAQCWMNGSGKFALAGDDCTNPNCVLYVRGYKKRPERASVLAVDPSRSTPDAVALTTASTPTPKG
jgi:hypothetical protein